MAERGERADGRHGITVDEAASEALRGAFRGLGDDLVAWKRAARRLGAHRSVNGADVAEIAVWTPTPIEAGVPPDAVMLEVLDAIGPLDPARAGEARFRRTLLPTRREGEVTFVAVRGMRAGTRGSVGSFYALRWTDGEGRARRFLDPMAASLPFGAFAPAEFYDVPAMLAARTDAAHWRAYAEGGPGTEPTVAPPTVAPPTNILQVHVPTATEGGTLAALTRRVREVAERLGEGAASGGPEPADALWLDFDAVQLLPVEPTTVYEAGPAFWEETGEEGDEVAVRLRRPDTTNWGYDVVIAGSAAVNPTLLESGRPDELVDLACALHAFPGGGIKLVFDVVFGHADNQALGCLDHAFLAGANMYGQNLDYRRVPARAQLLEMQRRKVDFGADGVRVDGAQDFKWWDASARVLRHDDEYLRAMHGILQHPAGEDGPAYRPWFVFEDGRPWPEEDWELASTYRAVTELLDDEDVFQWGPLTFAHNTPFLYTFWLSKLWRIRQIMDRGASWISGCSNHDTLRRGTQVDPRLNVNTRLGATRMEILDKAYDNPAVQMFTYAACPGVPMDFLNASARASWGFVRNQDDRYGVKVVAEEAISLKWQVDELTYERGLNFRRLKALGFETRDMLRRYLELLPALVEVTGYDLEAMARLLRAVEPPLAGPPVDVASMKMVARAWMDDMHEFVNVSHALDMLGGEQTAFDLALRRLRLSRPWLRGNLGKGERFDYHRPVDGSVVFETLRRAPGGEEVLTLTHMEGAPARVPVEGEGWQVLLATPGLDAALGPGAAAPALLELRDSTGCVFTRGEAMAG